MATEPISAAFINRDNGMDSGLHRPHSRIRDSCQSPRLHCIRAFPNNVQFLTLCNPKLTNMLTQPHSSAPTYTGFIRLTSHITSSRYSSTLLSYLHPNIGPSIALKFYHNLQNVCFYPNNPDIIFWNTSMV
jgi:hypothetical protein